MATAEKVKTEEIVVPRATARRTFVMLAAAAGLFAATTIGLTAYASGEESRAAENACRAAVVALDLGAEFTSDALSVIDVRTVDTTTNPIAARLVADYIAIKGPTTAGQALYVATGDLAAGHNPPQPMSCLVVFDGTGAVTDLAFDE